MASVVHKELPDGYQAIGIKDGKAFVPFVSIPPGHYASLKESAEQAGDEGDDDEKGGEK